MRVNWLEHTKYPERYRRSDTSPLWFNYEQRPPTPLGRDMAKAIGTDGTIVAGYRTGPDDDRYWLDPDCVLIDNPNVSHYIWLCDAWQEFDLRFFRSDRIRSDKNVTESFKMQGLA